MIDGILFDKDGTLFDFEATWSVWARDVLGALAADTGVAADRLGAVIGFDWDAGTFDAESPVIADTSAAVAAALAPVAGVEAAPLAARLDEAAARARPVPVPGLDAMLSALVRGGARIGLATNDAEEAAHRHLAAAGIGRHFDFIAGYDSGFGAKPAPGMCIGFARALSLRPEACFMVGDSLHDIVAGRAAGMCTIAVTRGGTGDRALVAEADHVVAEVAEIPALLGL